MLRSKKLWTRTGLAVFGLLLLWGAWTGWTAWQVNKDLNDAVASADRIQAAVEARDNAALGRELEALRDSSGAAADRTAGVTWSVLSHVPLVGDDARGIETTSRVLAELADHGIEPLVSASDRFDELLPEGGAIDLDAAAEMAEPVSRARAAFAHAAAELAGVDDSGFLGRLRTQFVDFRDQVSGASDALETAEVTSTVLPTMLGADGPRNYLLVFQNNAEIRGLGGLAGAIAPLEATDGRINLGSLGPASAFGEASRPVLPLSRAERALYDDVLGTYIGNATLTPDFPRAADLVRARWEQQFSEQRVDGVVTVDAVAISYLLKATGPVTVDGIEVSGDNVIDELLHRTYLRLDDPLAQDAFFADVAEASFDKFTSGVGDPSAALKALAKATNDRRLLVHAFDPTVQDQLAGRAIAGEFLTDPAVTAPQINVTVNDMTGSKMSYFLRYDIDAVATSCRDDVQTFSAKARFQSIAPSEAGALPAAITGGGEYGTEPGAQLISVRIFAPVGGRVSDVEFNGVRSDLIEVDHDGRPVAMTYAQLSPGEKVDLTWRMTSGSGQIDASQLTVTPTIERKDSTRILASACEG